MATSLRLRAWQKDALDAFERRSRPDFLAVATPGAGKTTFALAAVARDLAGHPHRRVVVVAPTSHLKAQWARSAHRLGIQLHTDWRPDDGWPEEFHGVVVTYQQVASAATTMRPQLVDAAVVFDEIHHAGAERSWGDAVAVAFGDAAWRLALSGTPFRSDANPIPFVTYEFDQAVPDTTYDYGRALEDGGVVRPVFFPRTDGHMEWTSPDGVELSATFDDHLDRTLASQRLRTALDPRSEWLPDVLARADEQLDRLRATDPVAAGLVIAIDVDHAHDIAALLRRRHGHDPVVATSDDPAASERIARFAVGDEPWIVAVRMVSEGVDIPRLRVGVHATTTTTELFFRQAVGRVVRWTPGQRRQKAFWFIPDDPRLRTHAARLAEHRTHHLQRRVDDGTQDEVALDTVRDADEQLSLFRAISATTLERDDRTEGVFDDSSGEDLIHDGDPAGIEVDLPTPPPRFRPDGASDQVPLAVLHEELRQACQDRVELLVRLTGLGHRDVHRTLNDQSGIGSVRDASTDDLRRRLRLADDWLARA